VRPGVSSCRRIAEEILGEEAGLEVETAVDGESALRAIEREPPDLVLTDLVMPGMDGLELVARVRERRPAIPVILMTSQGNEEIAVRALRVGAMSYVPKKSLATNLRETVAEVMDLAGRRRAEEEIAATLERSEQEFRLENRQELVRPLVKHLQETATQMGLCEGGECTQLGVALCEAVNNAMEHGNLEIESELREADISAHVRLMRERGSSSPWNERRVHVRAVFDRKEARFVVRDEGPGFDPATLPDPLAPANLDRLSGRGIMLIRSFMDEVEFNERGNQVTMVKRRA